MKGLVKNSVEETLNVFAEMDEDDYARLLQNTHRQCPFWRDGDDYAVVRHQI